MRRATDRATLRASRDAMLPSHRHPKARHPDPRRDAADPATDVIAGATVFVVDVDSYDLHRAMLYALGARSVTNKRMADVTTIVHGTPAPPKKALEKYPSGRYLRADQVLARFHRDVPTFGAYVQALQRHGFTVRNPSDEGDPRLDLFDLEPVDGSLHATLLRYLATSPFIQKFAHKQHFPIDRREERFVDFPVPGADVTWYYAWYTDTWDRVSATRGEGDYPLEIKGAQLLSVAPVIWSESTGLYFYEYPHADSVDGLFVQAGVDPRTGRIHGAAISRVWT